MRDQVKYVFQIGLPSRRPCFENDVIRHASSMCGGCTSSIKQGHWMSDGDQKQSVFMGNLQAEVCFEVELTCELEKAENVYLFMRNMIANLAEMWEVDTDWVHVSEIPMRGRHFSIASLNATPAAA